MTILYTLYKNTYIDLSHLDSTKGVTCYVNTTNRCPCACTFCLRQTKEMMENNSLWLKEEPSKEMIIEEFKKYNLNDFKEIVFCGFGEPMERWDDIKEVIDYIRSVKKDMKIRINTNGLANDIYGRDVTPEYKGRFDTVSISLNAPTKEEFLELTRSKFGIFSFDDMLDFAKKCKAYVPNVVLTVVDIIGEEKIEACRKITDEIGVTLRVRPFEE